MILFRKFLFPYKILLTLVGSLIFLFDMQNISFLIFFFFFNFFNVNIFFFLPLLYVLFFIFNEIDDKLII